uniref:Light-independent protochlorophyllide reductase subunit B n=1 Tax=Nephroselmis pyriformis TaxID=156128 RepID=A0A8A2H8C4_9CHLO|nr:ChlB subunit of protochlorophyllide reductase [Nephroselmis pyriformis]QSV37239.1 ChlB subunit of protochlorophyllide reductase [Nephroselmis pyriformis]
MQLAYWMYAGPAHVGTLRVTSSFKNVHAIMHAPLGDDYFHVMRSMLERERDFTPVTASIVDRDVLGNGTKDKVTEAARRKDREDAPDLIVVTPTCTSSILQEDLANFVDLAKLGSEGDVIAADVNHYRFNEVQAADRTLEQIVKFYIQKAQDQGNLITERTSKPSVNLLGIFTLGFHHSHDLREMKRLLFYLGIEVNAVLPEGADIETIRHLPQAWINLVPYREIGLMTAQFLEEEFGQPYVSTMPMGTTQTENFVREIFSTLQSLDPSLSTDHVSQYLHEKTHWVGESAWFSRSIDCQNLTGRRAIVFGDASHAAAMTRILSQEMGIQVVCAGTYCTHDAEWFRQQVSPYTEEILITEDHTQVGDVIRRLEPAAIFGTQMERHVGKRLGIPCGVISSPVHIQNFPLAYRPFCGYEGANQIADLVYNSFSLGMEEHLLEMFGGHDTKEILDLPLDPQDILWTKEGEEELQNIPRFVRHKVRKNTENYALQHHLEEITPAVLFRAKEAFGG